MTQKVIAADDSLQVYSEPDFASTTISQIRKGAVIELGDATMREEREWIGATLADGKVGYVLGPAARSHTTLGAGGTLEVADALKEIVEQERNPKKTEESQRGKAIGEVVDAAASVLDLFL
jgi:hypothetical protein